MSSPQITGCLNNDAGHSGCYRLGAYANTPVLSGTSRAGNLITGTGKAQVICRTCPSCANSASYSINNSNGGLTCRAKSITLIYRLQYSKDGGSTWKFAELNPLNHSTEMTKVCTPAANTYCQSGIVSGSWTYTYACQGVRVLFRSNVTAKCTTDNGIVVTVGAATSSNLALC
jgi:hypothetical protein